MHIDILEPDGGAISDFSPGDWQIFDKNHNLIKELNDNHGGGSGSGNKFGIRFDVKYKEQLQQGIIIKYNNLKLYE